VTEAAAPGRPRLAGSAGVVDRFGVVVAIGVTALWAVAGFPVFAAWPYVPDIPLLIAVGLVCTPSAIQWLALMRRFGASPPIAAAVGAVVLTLILGSVAGQLGALVGLSSGVIACYVWRIARASETRLTDVAYGCVSVVVFGFFPAQVLLLRRLDIGARGFYLYLAATLAYAVVQAVLARPARDGTRGLDASAGAAAFACVIVAVVGGVLGGPSLGAAGGLITGVAIAAASVAGRACLPLLAQAPVVEGRRIRRPPLLLDALTPLLFGAPAAFLALRAVAAA